MSTGMGLSACSTHKHHSKMHNQEAVVSMPDTHTLKQSSSLPERCIPAPSRRAVTSSLGNTIEAGMCRTEGMSMGHASPARTSRR